MSAEEQTILELGDIQSGALLARPSPYSGTYILLRIDDRHRPRTPTAVELHQRVAAFRQCLSANSSNPEEEER